MKCKTNRALFLALALVSIALLALLLYLAPGTGSPARAAAIDSIIKVPDDYVSIQAAIDAAADGDTILVAQGHYTENLRITQPITLSGGWNITWTRRSYGDSFIDGGQSGRVISITCATSDTVVTIDGFTIRNGDATGITGQGMPELPRWGDALSRSLEGILPGHTQSRTPDPAVTGGPDSISPTEQAAGLRADLADVAARGLYPGGEAAYQALLERLERRTTQAEEAKAKAKAPPAPPEDLPQQEDGLGGGIYSWKASPRLLNNVIYSNVATQNGTGWGGGVYVSYAAPGGVYIYRNSIYDNVASYSGTAVGGGLVLYEASGAVIEENSLMFNWGSGYGTGQGGGASVYASPDVVFEGNTAYGNMATLYGGGQGGGLHVYESPGTSVAYNFIELNVASGFGEIEEGTGGGIYVLDSSDVIVEGNSITDNTGLDAGILFASTGGAGGVMVDSSPNVIVRDNQVEGNTGNAAWVPIGYGPGGLQIFMADGALVTGNTIGSNLAVLEGGGGGGAMLVSYTYDALVTDNEVTGNWGIMFAPSGPGSGGGGGISLFRVYSTTVSANTIQENTGIIFRGGNCYGGGFFASAVSEGTQITGNDITSNIACLDNEDGLAGGGGGYVGDSEGAVVTGNTFENNLAGLKAMASRGGGMLLRNTVGSQVLGNRFVDNVAGMGEDAHGGGILLDSFFDFSRSATVDGNLFLNNRSSADPDADLSSGGACHVWIVLDGFWFTNNVLAGNQASDAGGLWMESAENADVVNNTFVDNADVGVFASVVTTHTTNVHFINNVVVSQSVGVSVSPGATTTVSYNLWDGVGTEVTGTGTISHTNPVYGDPAFANLAGDDYHLSDGSAAINAGDPAGVPPAPDHDADGVTRPWGVAVDLGAYEWQGYWQYLPLMVNQFQPAIGWAVGDSINGYGTILRTTDGGTNWVRQGSPADIPDTQLKEVSAVDAQHAWVVGADAVLSTRDGGLTWEPQTLPPDLPAGFELQGIKALDANTVYVVGTPSVLLHTADGGTWSQMAVGADVPAGVEFQTVDAVDASHIWAVGATEERIDPVIAFYDGLEWGLQPTDVLPDLTSAVIGVSAIDQQHAWAVGGWGMPLATTADGGTTWQVSDHPLSAGDMNRVVAVSPTTGWTAGDYGNVLYTTDAGATWYDVSLPSAFLFGVTALDDQTAWVVGPGVHGYAPGIIARTHDAQNWEVQSDPSWPNMSGISFVGARR